MTQAQQPPEPGSAGLLRRGATNDMASGRHSAPGVPGALAPNPTRAPAGAGTGAEPSRLKSLVESLRPLGYHETRPRQPRPPTRSIPRLPRLLITALLVGIIWFLAIQFGRPANLPAAPAPTPTPGSATQTPVAPGTALGRWHEQECEQERMVPK